MVKWAISHGPYNRMVKKMCGQLVMEHGARTSTRKRFDAGFFERVQRVPLLQHMHDLKTVKTVSTMLGV